MPASQLIFEHACNRRYPAWTLYARAFSGSRPDADNIVRQAIGRQRLKASSAASEATFHREVLADIRRTAFARTTTPRRTPSVLDALEHDPQRSLAAVRPRLRELSRRQRRAAELLFKRRPSLGLHDAARALRLSAPALLREVEHAVTELARAIPRGSEPSRASMTSFTGHPRFETLLAYASGALAGDEARALSAHASSCAPCGDRLGTMILLKASAAEGVRRALFSGTERKLARFVVVGGAVFGLGLGVVSLRPNPWAEHATRDDVPRWFHDFFYGDGRARPSGETSLGLEQLVLGDLSEAIRTLEPLTKRPDADPEAETYLGIARYLTGDTSRRTLRLLENGLQSNRAGRLARWYLANALLMRRDVDGARQHLKSLTTTRDWFGRAATALLDALIETEPTRLSAAATLR